MNTSGQLIPFKWLLRIASNAKNKSSRSNSVNINDHYYEKAGEYEQQHLAPNEK